MICAISKNVPKPHFYLITNVFLQLSFLDKLFQVFRDLEDLESTEDLQTIHDIVKAMGISLIEK